METTDASLDKFDREPFCKLMAEFLVTTTRGSRVVSLEGEWGEGKTTAIEAIIDLMGRDQADRRPFVVRVTPWKVGGAADLAQFLLSEFVVMLPREKDRISSLKRARILLQIARYADGLALAKAEPSTAVASVFFRAAAWVANRALQLSLDVERLKTELGKQLQSLDRPIVVFVDDVDRLLPDEVLSVVRFARAVGDFPGVTYVLAYDHPRVVSALGQAGVPDASLFLDKIVSMRMHLPPANRAAIRDVLLDELSRTPFFRERTIFHGSEDRQYEIVDFHLAGAISTPRAVERISAKVGSVPKEIFRDVEYWDVVGISALSIISPAVFDLIRARARFFVGEWKDFPDVGLGNQGSFDSFHEELAEAINNVPGPSRRYIRALVENLFPSLRSDGSVSAEWLELNGRIGASRGLYAYLRMALGGDEIPLHLVDLVLDVSPQAASELRVAVDSEGRFVTMLALLEERLRPERNLDPVTASGALRILTDHWAWLLRDSGSKKFKIGNARPLVRVFSELLGYTTDRAGIVDYALRNDESVAIGALILDYATDQSGKSPIRLPKFDQRDVALLSNRLAISLERALRYPDVDSGSLTSMAYALRRISLEEFMGVVERLSLDSSGRRRLLAVLGVTLTSGSEGEIASWPSDLGLGSVLELLEQEAAHVLSEAVEDRRLLASAKALVSKSKIVVATGEVVDY